MSEVLKDSGSRRIFESGAHRDMAEGKGDMFSLPAAAMLRISKHYELGAKKYTRLNYQKGVPVSSFMDSALRHLFKYLDGWDDEDHLAAAGFNVLGAMQMEARNPDMQDIEARQGKNTYAYEAAITAQSAPDEPVSEPKPPLRKVVRLANKGEWIQIIDNPYTNETYRPGDILQVVRVCPDGVDGNWYEHIHVHEHPDRHIMAYEYVVLEGYVPPEPVTVREVTP